MRDELGQEVRQLFGPDVADQRAVQAGQVVEVEHGRRRLAAVLVSADERDRVAAAGVRDGNARVAGDADERRHARDDLETDALFVQEQRLGAAAVEQERVAPLEAGDDLAFARLFGEQVADRFLFERLLGRHADVDALGVGPRMPEQPRVDEMVVEHDVGRREALLAAHRDEARVARAGADQVDDATHEFEPPRV